MGFELMTSSLPRMRSTPELHWLKKKSGRRGSNPRPSAWKADALPTELLPRLCGRRWTRTTEPEGADLQSAAIAAMRSSRYVFDTASGRFEPIEGFEPTTPRLQITCSGQLSYIGIISMKPFVQGIAKIGRFSDYPKLFHKKLSTSLLFFASKRLLFI